MSISPKKNANVKLTKDTANELYDILLDARTSFMYCRLFEDDEVIANAYTRLIHRIDKILDELKLWSYQKTKNKKDLKAP